MKLYAPMRLKEAYDVHQLYLDQRDKYQDVILERVLGGAGYFSGRLRRCSAAGRGVAHGSTADSAASLRRWTEPFNVLSWPAITIPLRTRDTTGVGDAVQVIDKPGQDLTVLRAAREIQALL
ncbi:amidase [Corynebacterium macginleyi]|uniref:amidase n=1 Tax=Corynebacterium macginleyi TaxID=38290 RepID=UPI001F470AF3|nr:amidase [Corynebacterium macginleyi]